MSNTAFPGITILRIDNRDSLTSIDHSGISVFHGERIPDKAKEMSSDIQVLVSKITPDLIEEKLGGEGVLFYSMGVKAASPVTAKGKARAYVRAKNPFEPSLIDTVQFDFEQRDGLLKTYNITLAVEK